MRVTQERAFVLHQYSHGETSLRLEVLTRQFGRIGMLAKGARRMRSPMRVALVPFQPMWIGFSGRGDLPVVTHAEPAGPAPDLSGSRLVCGLYLNELLVRLLHRHDPHELLFDVYSQSLTRLAGNEPDEDILRVFEKKLLDEIGYGLVLDQDPSDGKPIEADQDYVYVIDRGPVRQRSDPENGIPVRGETLLALKSERFDSAACRLDAKRLLRSLIGRQLGSRPLASRKLLRSRSPSGTVTLPPEASQPNLGKDE